MVTKRPLSVIKMSPFSDGLSWGIWVNANSVFFISLWFGSLISSYYATKFHENEKKMKECSSAFLLMPWLPSVRVIRKSAHLNFGKIWLKSIMLDVCWGSCSLWGFWILFDFCLVSGILWLSSLHSLNILNRGTLLTAQVMSIGQNYLFLECSQYERTQKASKYIEVVM